MILSRNTIVLLLISGNVLLAGSSLGGEPRTAYGNDAVPGIGRTDALGDPLPRGAVARIGTLRDRIGDGSGRIVFSPFHHVEIEHGFAFAPDGKTLVSVGPYFRYWDIARGKEIHRFHRLGNVLSVAFGPRGKTLATANFNALQLWDAATGREIRRIEVRSLSFLPVAFAPDGKTLVSGGDDKLVTVRDPVTGAERRRLEGHTAGVTSIAIAPDGKTMASGSTDGTAIIWDLETVGKD